MRLTSLELGACVDFAMEFGAIISLGYWFFDGFGFRLALGLWYKVVVGCGVMWSGIVASGSEGLRDLGLGVI